jgi:threonine/homoserine efflux transporter RhtA
LAVHEWVAIVFVVVASIGATLGARADDQPVEPGVTPAEVVVA